MARRHSVIRPTSLHVFLPEDIRAKLDLYLFSEVEGRVPVGGYGKFIAGLIKDFFEPKSVKVKSIEDIHSEKVQFAKYHAMQTFLIQIANIGTTSNDLAEWGVRASNILAGKFPNDNPVT